MHGVYVNGATHGFRRGDDADSRIDEVFARSRDGSGTYAGVSERLAGFARKDARAFDGYTSRQDQRVTRSRTIRPHQDGPFDFAQHRARDDGAIESGRDFRVSADERDAK
jgi:hypothetical protein